MGISPGVSKSINVDAKSLAVHHHGHHHHHGKHGHHHHHANVGAQGQISLSKTNQTVSAKVNTTHTAARSTVKMMKGELSVNGPLPADFGDRFAKEVAKATGCKAEDVRVLNTSAVPGETGIDAIVFEAPVDVIKAVEEQAADPNSKLATGPLRLFLIDKDADDSEEDTKNKDEDEDTEEKKVKKVKTTKKDKDDEEEKKEKKDKDTEEDSEDEDAKGDKKKASIHEEE